MYRSQIVRPRMIRLIPRTNPRTKEKEELEALSVLVKAGTSYSTITVLIELCGRKTSTHETVVLCPSLKIS